VLSFCALTSGDPYELARSVPILFWYQLKFSSAPSLILVASTKLEEGSQIVISSKPLILVF
jgi:hypothetical protein